MHRYKELRVFQFARVLVREIYAVSAGFPKEETYGLTSQIRRAATSVLLNISEGAGRNTTKDFAHFLNIASGSANEVEAAAIIALDQGYIEEKDLKDIADKIESLNNMLFKFQENLRSK
jgi:four helix bundle protein